MTPTQKVLLMLVCTTATCCAFAVAAIVAEPICSNPRRYQAFLFAISLSLNLHLGWNLSRIWYSEPLP